MNMKLARIFLLLTMLSSCVATKTNSNGIIKLSDKGDYMRAIRTPAGYYYNNPKDGKVIHIRNKQ